MEPLAAVQDAGVEDSPRDRLEAAWKTDAPKLWRALVAATGDRAVADDALSEAFAQALVRGDELRDPTRWIWRAAFKIAGGEMQHRGSTQPLDEHPVADDPEAVALVAALRQVTPRQRSVLVLHYYAGYRTREIAVMLGMSPATARVHLSTGRARLRRVLEDEDG
jgi:RNA polymerase sigma-70 factor (ECF subfamily)